MEWGLSSMQALDRLGDPAAWPWGSDTPSPLVEALSACQACEGVERHTLRCTRLFATVFDSSPAAIIITDRHNKIVAVNPGFTRLTGYEPEEVLGKNPSIMKSGRHDAAFYQAMWDALRTHGEWSGEVWDRRKNGAIYPKWLTVRVVNNQCRDGLGEPAFFVASFTDVSERKEAEERIRELAHHDVLTGLPNRLLLLDRLEHAMANAQRGQHHVAVLFIDLDRFKNINDSLGHAVGDQLLKEVASRLRCCVRDVDTVARLGGDEFVVVLENLEEVVDAVSVANKIRSAFSRPISVDTQALHVSTSIGIAIYPEDGTNAETLMQNADTAMYQAKAQASNNYQFFAPYMNEQAREKLVLENTLQDALAREEFQLYYQPIIDIGTGAMVSAEALIRWVSPERGLIPPDRFIPIAEETGTIVQIGDWVIRQACRDLVAWRNSGLVQPKVSLNLSPRQFRQPGLQSRIRATLEATGVSARQIELEVTESALMEHPDQAARLLNELKAMGIGIVIDDFGTGYSSLAYLKKFPIDKLKIDRSFVRDLQSDKSDREITLAVISLSHNLGLKVVAEGVETQAQLDFMHRHKCDHVQGFYFSKPLRGEEFAAYLADRSQSPTAPAAA
jgi:diguanylate cyclase (GGDEF)-like protein/PAS domain S-box-containing protein